MINYIKTCINFRTRIADQNITLFEVGRKLTFQAKFLNFCYGNNAK